MDTNTLSRLKKLTKDPAFVTKIKKVFFEAMMAGYASAEKIAKSSIAELPGSKLIPPYVKGPWKVSDPYLVNVPLSSFSGGTTVIAYEGVPVWMMHYFGMYPEDAIPTLKAALRRNYEFSEFLGGRGPGEFIRDGWSYWNHAFLGSAFAQFNGREHILSPDNQLKGWHMYHGGLMI